MRSVIRLLTLCASLVTLPAQEFRSESVTVGDGPFEGRTFQYRVFVPDDVAEGERLPVLLFLHGAGERGTDNSSQLRHLPERMLRDEYRKRFRVIVVAPQCRGGEMWMKVDWSKRDSEQATADSPWLDVAMATLRKTLAEEPCDPDRVYLTGLSMGGFGAWHLAARAPELFAAVVPICGGGDPASAAKLAKLPFFVWHGAADNVVPPERSRAMVRAVRAAGGIAHYVELPGVRHDSWNAAYQLEEAALDWLVARRRSVPYAGRVMACDDAAPRIVMLALDRAWDDPSAVVWEWRGEGLTDEQRAWFAHPTDVIPTDLATAMIVTAAGGGVFVVRLADRKVLFATRVDGEPGSVAELPDGSFVVSSRGDGGLTRLAPGTAASRTSIDVDGTRGLVWNAEVDELWAFGRKEVVVGLAFEDGKLVAKGSRTLPADFDRTRYEGIPLDRPLPAARITRLRIWP